MELRVQLAALEDEETNRTQANETITQLDLEGLADWIREADPQAVNKTLSSLCKRIWIHPDYSMDIEWR